MSTARLVILVVFIAVWTFMNWYTCWRICSIPWMRNFKGWRVCVLVFVVLWSSVPLVWVCGESAGLGRYLELVGMTWLGVVFLLFCSFLAVDLLTFGGFLFRRVLPKIRVGAALVGLGLSLIALIQGLRPPVVSDYRIAVNGLPPGRDSMVLVAISDLHLGRVVGSERLRRVVHQVSELQPDLVVLIGDVFDRCDDWVLREIVPELAALRSPLGVWAVTGNHEFYAGLERCVELFEAAGCRVLRDKWVEVLPGFILAGVDDLTARRQFGRRDDAIVAVLRNRPPGVTVLISHSPLEVETAAALGVDLMLSGHTHGGQIWPFGYLVQLMYPFLNGHYLVDGMHLIVGRGSGTWGPPMRLWRPAEIVRVRLEVKSGGN